MYLIQLDENGERTFLYWRNQSAARYLLQHPDYQKILAKFSDLDMLYLSGISLAILPKSDRLTLIHQLAELKKQGVQIVFDSNYRPALWGDYLEAQCCYKQLLPLVHTALVTFEDEQSLWRDKSVADTLERLSTFGVSTIVVKEGKAGATLKNDKKIVKIPALPIEQVIDTTSAGDAFNAGFLNGYLQGKDLLTCCAQGNELAGIVIQHKGAIIPKIATAHLLDKFN